MLDLKKIWKVLRKLSKELYSMSFNAFIKKFESDEIFRIMALHIYDLKKGK